MAQDTGKGTQGDGTEQAAAEATTTSDDATKTPQGSVETDKAGYASELVAYRVIDKLADTIASDVTKVLRSNDGARVLLVDEVERVAGGIALAEIKAQAQLLTGAFNEREAEHVELLEDVTSTAARVVSTPAHGAAMNIMASAIAGSVIGAVPWKDIPDAIDAVAGLLGYFGSNYKVSGREITVAKQALLVSTAGSLATTGGIAVFIPNFHMAGASPLLEMLMDLALRAAILKTERDLLLEELPGAGSEPFAEILDDDSEESGAGGEGDSGDAPNQERLIQVAKAVQRTTAVLATYEGFRTDWIGQPAAKAEDVEETMKAATTSTAPELTKGEVSKLSSALIQEEVERLRITHLLWISTYSAGGESSLRDRMFFLKDRMGFMGGATVGYVLAGIDGNILSANTLTQFGIIGGTLKTFSEGQNFEDIDYKPDNPRS